MAFDYHVLGTQYNNISLFMSTLGAGTMFRSVDKS